MPKRNAGRRGRTRKRRSGTAESAAALGAGRSAAATEAPKAPAVARAPRPRAAQRAPIERGVQRDPGGVGERPEAPWHPWPFSELLILVGAVGTIVGAASKDPALLFAGLGAVLLGTLEFTIREHRTGYRSHSSLLAAVPTAALHGTIALGLYALGGSRDLLVIAPLLIDIPVFWVIFRFLRARFEDARRQRVFALGRR